MDYGMGEKELIKITIDKYTDLQRMKVEDINPQDGRFVYVFPCEKILK